MFNKVLIANRGEIAVRVARACASLGVRSVAVYSDADRTALHVRACDEAYHIGPSPASESYLRSDKIIEVARQVGCDAIHPGYGFLSENAAFAQAVMDAGLTWIGPSPGAITLMGSKIESKRLAESSGVPVVPGYFGDDQSQLRLATEAERIGFPVLIKASAGGGGKGMRVIESPGTLREGIEGAQREAQAAFGDSSIMLEKYLQEPRHIEVQVLGDSYGNLIHLGERECSIQRRHQKVAEESPSPIMTDELRATMTASALALARAAGYSNAGTVEFIYQDGEYYFLEMNTRIQVEHPVTEEAIGFDLVEAQLRIAAGEELWIKQEDVRFISHAIECRLYAEDPERGFLPSTGKITRLDAAYLGPSVRRDAGVTQGDEVSPFYDPMIAKIITSGATRQEAVRRMQDALGKISVDGPRTNLSFLRWLTAHPQFHAGEFSTRFIERHYQPGDYAQVPVEVVLAGGALALLATQLVLEGEAEKDVWRSVPWRHSRQHLATSLLIEDRTFTVELSGTDEPDRWRGTARLDEDTLYDDLVELRLPRRTPGEVFSSFPFLQLGLGDKVGLSTIYAEPESRDSFLIAWEGREYWVRIAPPLSTETLRTPVRLRDRDTLESPMPGKVLKVLVAVGDQVAEDQPLVIIEAMKMEFTVRAPHDGKVARVCFSEGDQVAVGDVLIEMEK